MMKEIAFCVFTTHAVDREDQTPRRFISEDQLRFYKATEAELRELKATDAVRLVIWLRRALPRAILAACASKSKSSASAAPADPIEKLDQMPASTGT